MHPSSKPSKQFLIRGSIAIGVVALILFIQTNTFRSLIHKTPTQKISTTTVGDIISQDTNNNGIADWEEKLWGLDPTVLYTNGIPNKTIIETKKKALNISSEESTPKNETDKIAQELFVLTQGLGQSDAVDTTILSEIATKLGSSLNLTPVVPRYSAKDLTTAQTTPGSLQTYYATMKKKVSSYESNIADIDVIITALETGDTTRVPELLKTAKTYRSIAKELTTIPVPVGIATDHLTVINSFLGVADSFTYLQGIEDNATQALIGISLYTTYSTKLNQAITNIQDYLTRYGILIQ